jgi:hypothetical protein
MCEPLKPRKAKPRVKRIAGNWECRAAGNSAKANVDIAALELIGVELPGVVEDGMSGRNGQRKPGTTRGSPRRSRTAKASRISRSAVKSRCACEWGGWGRLSDDGPGHYNPDPSEGPWGRWRTHLMAVHKPSPRPDTERDYRGDHGGARRADANQHATSVCREQA